jgi:hypothetical protein
LEGSEAILWHGLQGSDGQPDLRTICNEACHRCNGGTQSSECENSARRAQQTPPENRTLEGLNAGGRAQLHWTHFGAIHLNVTFPATVLIVDNRQSLVGGPITPVFDQRKCPIQSVRTEIKGIGCNIAARRITGTATDALDVCIDSLPLAAGFGLKESRCRSRRGFESRPNLTIFLPQWLEIYHQITDDWQVAQGLEPDFWFI